MNRFVKWGSATLLAALGVAVVWSATDNTGVNRDNNVQRARFVQPLPGVGAGGSTSNAGNTGGTGMGQPVTSIQATKQVAEGVPGVKAAWPVQTGNDVLLGIELSKGTAASAASVADIVARRVDARVPAIDNLQVVTQPAQVSRLKTIYQSTLLGGPSGDYAREVAEIWGAVRSGTASNR